MLNKTQLTIATVAATGVAVGVGATLLADRGVRGLKASRFDADLNAQIERATPARELIVMYADGRVFSGAQKNEMLAQSSKLYFVSRARFTYSVDMRGLSRGSFNYNRQSDVLRVRLPRLKVQASLYGPRERIAQLALLATEGGSGNELERDAGLALERDANREASRPEVLKAAVTSAKYEVSKLYEDAFRAAGRKTRVVVFASGEPFQ